MCGIREEIIFFRLFANEFILHARTRTQHTYCRIDLLHFSTAAVPGSIIFCLQGQRQIFSILQWPCSHPRRSSPPETQRKSQSIIITAVASSSIVLLLLLPEIEISPSIHLYSRRSVKAVRVKEEESPAPTQRIETRRAPAFLPYSAPRAQPLCNSLSPLDRPGTDTVHHVCVSRID